MRSIGLLVGFERHAARDTWEIQFGFGHNRRSRCAYVAWFKIADAQVDSTFLFRRTPAWYDLCEFCFHSPVDFGQCGFQKRPDFLVRRYRRECRIWIDDIGCEGLFWECFCIYRIIKFLYSFDSEGGWIGSQWGAVQCSDRRSEVCGAAQSDGQSLGDRKLETSEFGWVGSGFTDS